MMDLKLCVKADIIAFIHLNMEIGLEWSWTSEMPVELRVHNIAYALLLWSVVFS